MLEIFQPGISLSWDLIWQSSLFLVIGLAASLAIRGRPARAHRVLVLAMLAAVCTPLLAQAIRHGGWGLLRQSHAMAAGVEPAIPKERDTAPAELVRVSQRLPGPGNTLAARGQDRPIDAERISQESFGATRPVDEDRLAGAVGSGWLVLKPSWRQIMLGFWVLLSGLAISRFVVSFVEGFRLVRGSVAAENPGLSTAISRAVTRLGLASRPELRSSPWVRCPSVWCWGRQPILLVPARVSKEDDAIDWVAIFCHELAHWRRLDHLATLASELLVCVLPWNPLAWWAKARLSQIAELACDDWVLACGSEGTDYAASLLELVPQRGPALALTAVSSRGGLVDRVRHILDERRSSPRIGKGWAFMTGVSMTLAAFAISLAQTRPVSSAQTPVMKSPRPEENATRQDQRASVKESQSGRKANRRTLRGEVRDTGGKPVAGASVFAIGNVEPRPEMIKGQLEYVGERLKVVGQSTADNGGRFQLELLAGPEVSDIAVVARAPDSALSAANFSIMADEKGQMRFPRLGDDPITLTLSRSIPIEGRLLSPAGDPVAGARVELVRMESGKRQRERDQWSAPAPESGSDGRPTRLPYWPDPVVSDSQGRFHLGGYSKGTLAEITITHDEYIHEALTIAAAGELYHWYTQHNLKPLTPRFTYVLEPSRPIEETVKDKDTGRPIEGVAVEMFVSRPPDWRFFHKARTDASGHYRVRGVGWNHPAQLFTNVSPGADSGYLPIHENRGEWPAGTRDLVWDFKLQRGRVVRGTVIAAETRKPIAGARIGGGSGAMTDPNGNFALAVLPGQQAIFVDGPTPDYQRVKVSRGVASPFYTFFPHGFAKIDAPPSRAIEPLEILLKKGATISAQAVDPEGKPLSNVWISGMSLYAELDRPGSTAGRYATGLFQMSSFVPGQTYRIFFVQNERHLAGFADITAQAVPGKPINVTLRPMASVRGTLRKPDGSPNTRRSIDTYLHMVAEDVKLDTMVFLASDVIMSMGLADQRGEPGLKTNDQGEFLVAGIVPGARNYLVLLNSSNRVEYLHIEPLQPGEVRDLGAVKPIVLTEMN